MIRRILYFGYYLKELDSKKFRKFIDFASKSSGTSRHKLAADSILSSFKYNISLLDYFYFRFYELNAEQRKSWAGTGFMYEYHLKTNPRSSRMLLEDKLQFLNRYKDFVLRKFASIASLEQNPQLIHSFLHSESGKVVVKNALGQVGKEVKVLQASAFDDISLLKFMKTNHFDLLEDFVVQHPDLMALSPSGLNTVRIFTHIHEGNLHYLGGRLRITINSEVDNMAAGNPAASIDIKSGVVIGPAVFSDITMKEITTHPVTGVHIIGFKVPYWDQVIEMINKVAFLAPENRSVGWDIAISQRGPELIEGNHNWCKLLWQLPVKKGLKQTLIDLS